MTIRWERRSAGDGGIIGQDVYDPDSRHLIGVPQLASPHPQGGWVVIVKTPGSDVPVHMRLYDVLLAIDEPDPPEQKPGGGAIIEDNGWGYRVHSSPERRRRMQRADELGADWSAREEGVAGDEEALPPVGAPEPDPDDRPSGSHVDPTATIHPSGKPLGRKKNDSQQEAGSVGVGGSTMASVAEVKAAIDAANQQSQEAASAVRAGIEKLAEAQTSLAVAFDGSGNDIVTAAQASLEHAKQTFEDGIQAVMASIEQSQQYGAGL